jgi:predicted nuclease with TOPRIM domain
MHPALQIALGVASLVVVLSQIVARWGGRAQRQESDGRVLERVEGAAQTQAVTGATLASSLSAITAAVGKIDSKLDRLTEDHRETRETSVRHEAERTADRDRIARLEADNASLRAELRAVDDRQTARSHQLRNDLHGPTAVSEVVAAIKAQSEATARAADAMASVAARLPKGRA